MARLFCQDIIGPGLTLAAVDALEHLACATLGGAKESVQKSQFVAFCEARQYSALFVMHVSVISAQQLLSLSPPSSPLFPVRAFKLSTAFRWHDYYFRVLVTHNFMSAFVFLALIVCYISFCHSLFPRM